MCAAADANPTNATGTVTFDDADLSDVPTASITGAVVSADDAGQRVRADGGSGSGPAGDSLSPGAVSFSDVDGSGSVGWTYSVTNAEIDFLGDDDVVELTFTVQIDDGQGGTDAQNVVITITGTNDVPIIDSAAQTGTIVETVDACGGGRQPDECHGHGDL